MRATATSTETSAVRRCGVTGGAYSGGRLERPDDDVEPAREGEDRLAGELDGRDRRQLDLGLCSLERPRLVVDLGPVEASAVVDRVEAVALGQERLL